MSTTPGAAQTLDEHALGLRAWVERCADGEVVRSEPHAGGSHRIAWQIDVASGGGAPRALFLTLDAPGAGGEGGNARDAAVLTALSETPLPVPVVVGRDGPGGALLMERVAGSKLQVLAPPVIIHESFDITAIPGIDLFVENVLQIKWDSLKFAGRRQSRSTVH